MGCGYRQAARALQGKTFITDPDQIGSDTQHNELEYLEFSASHNPSLQSVSMYRAIMLVPLYLYGYHDKVVETGTKVVENIRSLWSSRYAPHTYFYISLAILSLHLDDPSRPGLLADMDLVKEYKAKIDFMSNACDVNYGMWSLLLEALLCEVDRDFPGTVKALEVSITGSCEISSLLT